MTRFKLGAPWLVIAGCMTLGFVVALAASVRTGGTIIALGLFAGAGMRAVLPERYVPDIKVRSRTLDVSGYAALGLITFVAFTGVKLN